MREELALDRFEAIVAGATPTLIDDDDCLYVSTISAPQKDKAGKSMRHDPPRPTLPITRRAVIKVLLPAPARSDVRTAEFAFERQKLFCQ